MTPLDLLWNEVDINGLPLNPTWRGYRNPTYVGPEENRKPEERECVADVLCPVKACPWVLRPNSTSFDDYGVQKRDQYLNDWGRCSSLRLTFNRSFACRGHVNWFPATFEGALEWEDRSKGALNFDDDDYNFNMNSKDPESRMGRGKLHVEFDAAET